MKATLSVSIPPGLFASLTAAAGSAGVTRSWLVGRVLGEWLAQHSISAPRDGSRERGEVGGVMESHRHAPDTPIIIQAEGIAS